MALLQHIILMAGLLHRYWKSFRGEKCSKMAGIPNKSEGMQAMDDSKALTSTETPTNASYSKSEDTNDRSGKYLTFFLEEEEYGLAILKVHEIIRMLPITPVPRSESYIKGVVNLRGKVIPVIDLRLKLSMASTEQTDGTCIVVVQSNGTDVGLVVDRVSEVLDIASKDIDDAPLFGMGVNTDYILGIGKSGERVKMLLDIDQVLSLNTATALTSTMQQTVDPSECNTWADTDNTVGRQEIAA